MNSYILALLIVLLGILLHYIIDSTKESFENEKKPKEETKAAAEQQEWQGTVDWYTQQLTNLSNLAKKQKKTISDLETNNKRYQAIYDWLQYRKKQMDAILEEERKQRGQQGTSAKASLSDAITTVNTQLG